ncbi:MAG: hypothetical protein AAF490_06950 [Chloroflexota bacterium]
MQKKAIIYLLFALLLFACSPQVESSPVTNDEPVENEEVVEPIASGEETAVDDSEPEISAPEPDENEAMDNELMNENSEEDAPIIPEETPAISRDNIAAGAQEQKSEPVVVDLGELVNPEPSDDEPIEQPAPGIPGGTAKLVEDVRLDLSNKLNVDVASIETVSVEEVMWRDSSLGCPVAGMSYLQVLTSGFRIILEVDSQTYSYHSKDTNNFILCENPQSPAPSQPGNGLGDT